MAGSQGSTDVFRALPQSRPLTCPLPHVLGPRFTPEALPVAGEERGESARPDPVTREGSGPYKGTVELGQEQPPIPHKGQDSFLWGWLRSHPWNFWHGLWLRSSSACRCGLSCCLPPGPLASKGGLAAWSLNIPGTHNRAGQLGPSQPTHSGALCRRELRKPTGRAQIE